MVRRISHYDGNINVSLSFAPGVGEKSVAQKRTFGVLFRRTRLSLRENTASKDMNRIFVG